MEDITDIAGVNTPSPMIAPTPNTTRTLITCYNALEHAENQTTCVRPQSNV